MATFIRDGIYFNFSTEGAGLPFIFQHGLGGDLQQPRFLYEPRGAVQRISLYARGHGATRPLVDPKKLRFNVVVDDVIALMDHLRIDQAAVGGISMGAGIALNLTLRYPARVRGLVMVRPAWLDRPNPWTVAMF